MSPSERRGNNLNRFKQLKPFKGVLPESQGQNLALTFLYVPYSLDGRELIKLNSTVLCHDKRGFY